MSKRYFILLSLVIFGSILARSGFAQSLEFGNNYFVTGDYVVGGVGLASLGDSTGYATGIIKIPDSNPGISPGISGTTSVPAGAQIVAAFLYWETVESSQAPGSGKNGFFRPLVANGPSTGYAITGVPLKSSSTNGPVAWSSGGCSGGSQGTKEMQPYRADVLGLLAQDPNGNVQANVSYEVRLPDSGSNGSAPVTLGATFSPLSMVTSPGGFSPATETSYSGTFAIGNPVPTIWTLQLTQDNSYVSNFNVNTLLAIGPVPLVNGACPLPSSVTVFFNNAGNYPYPVSTLYSLQTGIQAGSTFTFNASNQFVFSWTTTLASVAAGCYVIELDLDSGQVERTALKLAAPYIFTGFYSPLVTAAPPTRAPTPGRSTLGNRSPQNGRCKPSTALP